MANQFNMASYLVRLIFAVLLVFGTYNPSGYSYFHWLIDCLFIYGGLGTLPPATGSSPHPL